MKFLFCSAFILIGLKGLCQSKASIAKSIEGKPSLDTSVFRNWPSVGSPLLSNDGSFASYSINNEPKDQQTLVIREINSGKDIKILNARQAAFTNDSRQLIFLKADSLGILSLDSGLIIYKPKVRSFRLFMRGKQEILAWQNFDSRLRLKILHTGHEQEFEHINSYIVSKDGQALLLNIEDKVNDMPYRTLRWVDLSTFESFPVWYSSNESEYILPEKIVFSVQNDKVAFIKRSQEKGQVTNSLWYFDYYKKNTVLLVDDVNIGLDSGLRVAAGLPRFSVDGLRIFFSAKEPEPSLPPKLETVKIDVWSYIDTILQSQQLYELDHPSSKEFAMVIDILSRKISRLQYQQESITFFAGGNDDVVIVRHQKNNENERNWNKTAAPSTNLVFTKTGKRKKLSMDNIPGVFNTLSPNGNYIIFADKYWRQFYCYNILTHEYKSITSKLPIPLIDKDFDYNPLPKPRGLYFITWFKNGNAILIRDKYDLWKLDVKALMDPINITNGYGRKNKVCFRLAKEYELRYDGVSEEQNLLLSAFNEKTKMNGFYQIFLGQIKDPEMLKMAPNIFSMPSYTGTLPYFAPIKAKDANKWLVRSESASSAPNFFLTDDFKKFTPLSNCHPEDRYNWLTSELISFKSVDGKILNGVLYKPENFDPEKKYPVIIHYYEKLSFKLNVFENPEAMGADMNIPWFVSNGYLVFTPDIQFVMGRPGQSAFNSVLGATAYLAKQSFVDKNRIGLQGHSWGGFETNYIVTHTNKFAAAMSSCGMVDFIHGYGSVLGNGRSKQFFFEIHQSRIGYTLWDRPDLYIKSSPIFYAHNVTTPILLMSNKLDGSVGFDQGLSFFLALRRLGKRSWMFQYDGEGHGLGLEGARVLHTVMVTQFFNHYLKNAPAPRWMINGINASQKGMVDLLSEMDAKTGKRQTPPIGGLLIDERRGR